jgi:uncharacterized protein
MKVVIDTNILISAILKDRDPQDVILFVAHQPDFEWIVSAEILQEYSAVIRRPKFKLPENLIQQWDEMFKNLTTVIQVDQQIEFPRDPKDAKFLACALTADAQYFITGDKDFAEATKLIHTTIISVTLFKKYICDTWS